jgi:hypothetical protein
MWAVMHLLRQLSNPPPEVASLGDAVERFKSS